MLIKPERHKKSKASAEAEALLHLMKNIPTTKIQHYLDC
jgi:hypothetical protein